MEVTGEDVGRLFRGDCIDGAVRIHSHTSIVVNEAVTELIVRDKNGVLYQFFDVCKPGDAQFSSGEARVGGRVRAVTVTTTTYVNT